MTVTPITSLEQFKEIVAYTLLCGVHDVTVTDFSIAPLQINSGKYVVIDFWAEWCGPCRVISPVFEKLSGATPGVEFYKVDVDDQEAISQEVGIRAVELFFILFCYRRAEDRSIILY